MIWFMQSGDRRLTDLRFFIVRDVNRTNIVLSIRGTLNAKDILTDLCATAEGFDAEAPCKESKDTRNPGNISLFARIFGGKTPKISNANCTSFRAHHGISMHVPNRYEDELRVLWNSYQSGSKS
jgi:hypothetical protein